MAKPKITRDGKTITVRVPIAIRKRGGRKVVLAPDVMQHDPITPRCQHADDAMVKALARAFRWREMLEAGTYSTIKEIAQRECINESYIARVLRLTLLSPRIVEAIISGRSPAAVTLATLMASFPAEWGCQETAFGRGRF
jgi:hypothetical protein